MHLHPAKIILIQRKRGIHRISGQDQPVGDGNCLRLVSQTDPAALLKLYDHVSLRRSPAILIACAAERTVRQRHFDVRGNKLFPHLSGIIREMNHRSGSETIQRKGCLNSSPAHCISAGKTGPDQVRILNINFSSGSAQAEINDRFQELLHIPDPYCRSHFLQTPVRKIFREQPVQVFGGKRRYQIQIARIAQ